MQFFLASDFYLAPLLESYSWPMSDYLKAKGHPISKDICL